MTMTRYERILLVRARQLIESGKEQFICCALEAANSIFADAWDLAKHESTWRMKSQVQSAIDDKFTLEVYLYEKYGIRYEREGDERDYWDKEYIPGAEIVYFPRDKYDTFVLQARLAWIDRMLDNNEVK
jgi:hypothetical protein